MAENTFEGLKAAYRAALQERDEARALAHEMRLLHIAETDKIAAERDTVRALLREIIASGEMHLGLHREGISMLLPHDLYRRVTEAALVASAGRSPVTGSRRGGAGRPAELDREGRDG